ncbi:hypothetical protein ACTWP5_07060 [Streptomyces sp. 4N509B]|uniref:hypothetical protein n=1 Tax=Streptomyces sp. 4N509B TaxID=3457413 RepID=UPI003FD4F91C
MTDAVPVFDYPASEEWFPLSPLPLSDDGIQQITRQVIARGGRQNKRHARTLSEHLKLVWQAEAHEIPIQVGVIYVPHTWPVTCHPAPVRVFSVRYPAGYEETIEEMVHRAPQPQDNLATTRPMEATTVDLPGGTAYRTHWAESADTGYPRIRAETEHVDHYFRSEACPDETVLLSANWSCDNVGSGVVELVDQIAASLRVVSPGSGNGPRPVLAAPDGRVVFAETQIGRGMRPLAQHGFVVIEQGVLTLLDSDRQPIDSAPLPQVQASKRGITGGAVVALTLANGEKYNVSPGWGAHRGSLSLPGLGNPVKDAANTLVRCVENGGGTVS